MLFPEAEEFPDLAAITLDEIFAIGVVVNPQVDNLFGPVTATMPLDETINGRLDLKLPLSAVLDRQVKEQVAMRHLGLPT